MAQVTISLVSKKPLIMNNPRSVDPFNEEVQKLHGLTSQKNNTLETLRMIELMEWELKLYYDPEIGVYIPVEIPQKASTSAAAKFKLTNKWKAGFQFFDQCYKLIYDGPQKYEDLRRDRSFYYRTSVGRPSGRGKVRIMSTRPIFPIWSLVIPAYVDETELNLKEVADVWEETGLHCGFGDRRPIWGRFNAKVTNGHR
jgi:hypothetical protein